MGTATLTNVVKATSGNTLTSSDFFDPDNRLQIFDRLKAFRAIPGEDKEATIRWGKAGFEQVPPGDDPNDNFSINLEEDDPPPAPPDQKTLVFNEIDRKVTPVRVENPDDPEQFVMVERIDNITFKGPDGIDRQFVLNPPE